MTGRWRWRFVAEMEWNRWGIGVEVSLGAWYPREWSLYAKIGPLMIGGGIEWTFTSDGPPGCDGEDGCTCPGAEGATG